MGVKKRFWFDTEFIEYPPTIDLISIGITNEKDEKLYLVSSEFDESKANRWVQVNVLPQLPPRDARVSRDQIRDRIIDFVSQPYSFGMFPGEWDIEFWSYYADYDWVAFCWLFGKMIDLPRGYPKYCLDIKQLIHGLGNPRIPEELRVTSHTALADAIKHKKIYEWAMKLKGDK